MFVNLSPETSLEVLKHLTRFKLENLRLTNLEFNNFIVSQKRYLPIHNLSVNVEWHSMKPLDVRVNIQLKNYKKNLPDWQRKKILFTRYAGGYVDSMLGIQLRDLDEMIHHLILHMRNAQVTMSIQLRRTRINVMYLVQNLLANQSRSNFELLSLSIDISNFHTFSPCDWLNFRNKIFQSSIWREMSLADMLKLAFSMHHQNFNICAKADRDQQKQTMRNNKVKPTPFVFRQWQVNVCLKGALRTFTFPWEFPFNFPDTFIEIFHQSRPEDITWPSYIMVAPFANSLQILRKRNSGDDLCDTYYQKMESDQTLEYIWPNIRDLHCHRISKHLLEIPHKNGSQDGRILRIRFEKISTNDSTCNLIFETIDSRNQES